jgi:hypothetical protein
MYCTELLLRGADARIPPYMLRRTLYPTSTLFKDTRALWLYTFVLIQLYGVTDVYCPRWMTDIRDISPTHRRWPTRDITPEEGAHSPSWPNGLIIIITRYPRHRPDVFLSIPVDCELKCAVQFRSRCDILVILERHRWLNRAYNWNEACKISSGRLPLDSS